MSKRLAILITVLMLLAAFSVTQAQGIVVGSGTTVTTTIQPAPFPGNSGQIIMRDGGVCDPIRHMGC